MADIALISSVAGKVFTIGWAIKDAVQTDHQNKKQYRSIVRSVGTISSILWCLVATELLQHPAMRAALDDLADSLKEALDLINACQGRNTITRLCLAGSTAKKLRRVKDDINEKLWVGMFAVMAQIITLTATIKQRQISVVTIKVDLGCWRCYRKMEVTLFKLLEMTGTMKNIDFDDRSNKISVAGSFDPDWLSRKLFCKAGKLIMEIMISEEPVGRTGPGSRIVEEPIGGTDPGPPAFVQGTDRNPSSAQAQCPPRDDDGLHASNYKGSEGPLGPSSSRSPSALPVGHEASPRRPSSASESRVQPRTRTAAARTPGRPLAVATCSCRGTKGVVPERRPWR